MQEDLPKFISRKARIVVVAPHSAETVRDYWLNEHISFTGVPDPDGDVGKLYGQEWKLLKLGRMPALFIVDRKGKIAFSQYAKNMADIPANTEILGILDRLK